MGGGGGGKLFSGTYGSDITHTASDLIMTNDLDGNNYNGRQYDGTRNISVDFINTKGNSTLNKHYIDHNADFNYKNDTDYLNGARNFLDSLPTSTTQSFVSKDGWYFRYDTATNEFGIINQYGGISTYFKPTDGMNYWLEQIKKYAH